MRETSNMWLEFHLFFSGRNVCLAIDILERAGLHAHASVIDVRLGCAVSSSWGSIAMMQNADCFRSGVWGRDISRL